MAGMSNGTSHGRIEQERVTFPSPHPKPTIEEEAEFIVRMIRLRHVSPQDGVRAIVRLVEERCERERSG